MKDWKFKQISFKIWKKKGGGKESMKLTLSGQTLTITYENNEWAHIESIHRQLGLTPSTTRNGWGRGVTLNYYRQSDSIFKDYLTHLNSKIRYTYDDINRPIVYFDDDVYLNLAIFRVIPNNSQVSVELERFLDVREFSSIITIFRNVLSSLFNVVFNAEVSFNFQVVK